MSAPDLSSDSDSSLETPEGEEAHEEEEEEGEEVWAFETYYSHVLLKKAAGAPRASRKPPPTWLVSPAVVREWFTLSDDRQKEEEQKYKDLSPAMKAECRSKIPGYEERRATRRSRPQTRNSRDGRRRRARSPEATTPAATRTVTPAVVRRGIGSTGLADDIETRESTMNATAPAKKRHRSRKEAAKNPRQKHDAVTRHSRDIAMKAFARHVRQTASEDGSANDYRALLCFENNVSDATVPGGRDKKGSVCRDQVHFMALGHRLKEPEDLKRWAKRLMDAAKNLEDRYEVVMLGQRSSNNIVDDTSNMIRKLKRGRTGRHGNSQDHTETTATIAASGGAVIRHTPERMFSPRRLNTILE